MPGNTDHAAIGVSRRELLRRAATETVDAWERYDSECDDDDTRARRRLAQAIAALRAQLQWTI